MRKGKRRQGKRRQRTTLVLTLALIAGLGATAPAGADTPAYAFRDPNLPVDKRVDDLLGRLTLDEKVSLLHQYEPAIPRLGIQSFRTGTEALHGVAWLGEATVFPQAVGLARTWDPALMRAGRLGGRRRGARLPAERPDGLGPQPVGAGGEPAARPALGPQRGGLLRGPVR